jgi:hypothetical protein
MRTIDHNVLIDCRVVSEPGALAAGSLCIFHIDPVTTAPGPDTLVVRRAD